MRYHHFCKTAFLKWWITRYRIVQHVGMISKLTVTKGTKGYFIVTKGILLSLPLSIRFYHFLGMWVSMKAYSTGSSKTKDHLKILKIFMTDWFIRNIFRIMDFWQTLITSHLYGTQMECHCLSHQKYQSGHIWWIWYRLKNQKHHSF